LHLFSGKLTSSEVDVDGKWVEDGEHVTCMQAISGQREERKHFFSIPDLGPAENFVQVRIPELSAQDPTQLGKNLSLAYRRRTRPLCARVFMGLITTQ
jgi:hypothetical protein